MRTELLQSPLNKDTTEKEMDAKKTLLKKEDAQQCLLCYCPEVVLPTYMASAFGLDKGVLADIIGTDGLDEKMHETYFDNKPKVGARFITLNGGTVHYTTIEFIAEGCDGKQYFEKCLLFE
jgi:hypothetical protein